MKAELNSLQKKNKSLVATLAYWKKQHAELSQRLAKQEQECQRLKGELDNCRKTRTKVKYQDLRDLDLGV